MKMSDYCKSTLLSAHIVVRKEHWELDWCVGVHVATVRVFI